MKNYFCKNRRRFLGIIGISILLGILMEGIMIWNSETLYEYEGLEGVTSIYPGTSYEMIPVAYELVEDGTFIPQNEDPQLVFPIMNNQIDGILVDLAIPLGKDTLVQVYYQTKEHSFSEDYVVISEYKENSTQIYIDMPASECTALRLDINGTVNINEIVIMEHDDIAEYRIKSERFAIGEVVILTVLIGVGLLLVEVYKGTKRKEYSLNKLERVYCLFCFVFYFFWAISKPFNYGPDEYMRYDVSLFFYNNNRLPRGTETINAIWGFSYAHLPTMLCNLLSYIPMKIVGYFTQNEFWLVVAARMVSVFCGTGVVYFVTKTAKVLFHSSMKWIMIVLVSMIPQFVFLTSYLNNDIVALFGSAIILYAWSLALKKCWNIGNSICLACGIIVCALAYYNSYAWILCSIVFFILSILLHEKDYKKMLKLGGLISVIVLVGISYMFVRHAVLYGDILGLQTEHKYMEQYGVAEIQAANNSLFQKGVPVWYMLFDMRWLELSYKSFIGYFGYMNVPVTGYVYSVYSALFIVGLISFICSLLNKMITNRSNISKTEYLFTGMLFICIAVPVFLSVYYSYTGGFQAQGRYCYPAWLAIGLLVTKGLDVFLKKVCNETQKPMVVNTFCVMLLVITISEFFTTYLPS